MVIVPLEVPVLRYQHYYGFVNRQKQSNKSIYLSILFILRATVEDPVVEANQNEGYVNNSRTNPQQYHTWG